MKPQFDIRSDFFFRNIPFIENYIFLKIRWQIKLYINVYTY